MMDWTAFGLVVGGLFGTAWVAVGAVQASVKYEEPLPNRETSFGRIPFNRRRRKALAAFAPAALAAVERKQLHRLDDKELCEMGMSLDGLYGNLKKEPDVAQALAALTNEFERRAAASHRVQWLISTIEERRAKAVDQGIRDLERRNKARIDVGLPRIDDELLWKAPPLGALSRWAAAAFATDRLQIAAVPQMEELLRAITGMPEHLLTGTAAKLSSNTFWAVGAALELFAITLPWVSDSPADQELMDGLRRSYDHWCLEARNRGPAPVGESLLSRDITINAATHELRNRQQPADQRQNQEP